MCALFLTYNRDSFYFREASDTPSMCQCSFRCNWRISEFMSDWKGNTQLRLFFEEWCKSSTLVKVLLSFCLCMLFHNHDCSSCFCRWSVSLSTSLRALQFALAGKGLLNCDDGKQCLGSIFNRWLKYFQKFYIAVGLEKIDLFLVKQQNLYLWW